MECILIRCVDSKKATSHSSVSLLQRLANVMATCCMCRGAKKKRKKLHGLTCKESRLIVSTAYGSNA